MIDNSNYSASLSNKTNVFFICLVLSCIAIYLIFSSVSHIPFYHHDVYKYTAGGRNVSCELEVGYSYMFDLARPLCAYADCLNFKLASNLSSMSDVRIWTSLVIGIMTGLVAFWLCCTYFSVASAIFIAITLFCLPALQVAMIMGGWFLVLAILAAFVANISVDLGFVNLSRKSVLSVLIGILYLVIGISLLFVSLFSYPALTGFFLIPAFMLVLFKPLTMWPKTRFVVIRDIVIFFICCAIFFMIAKHTQMVRQGIGGDPGRKFHLAFDPVTRLESLLAIFPTLWKGNTYAGIYQAVSIYCVALFGILLSLFQFFKSEFYKRNHSKSMSSLVQALIAGSALLVLGSAHYFVQPMELTFTRLIYVYQAMSVILLVWCLFKISLIFKANSQKVFMILLGAMFIIASVEANYITIKSALNDNMELNFIASTLGSHIKNHEKIARIHLISTFNRGVGFNGLLPSEDIFNNNSTVYSADIRFMINTALSQFVNPKSYHLVDCAYSAENISSADYDAKCIAAAPAGSIVITRSSPGQPFEATKDTVIIDMNDLGLISSVPRLNMS